MNIPTLRYRRYRGDMTEAYKILYGIYNTTVSPGSGKKRMCGSADVASG